VAGERVRRGQLTGAEMDRVMAASGKLAEIEFYLDDTPAMTVQGIRTRARRLKRLHGLDLVIVDYLQLIDADRRRREGNRVQEVSEITRGLKTLAKELDVPVVALSQLSRAVEGRADRRPLLSDLRESGSIEQDADVVIFIYREEYYRKLAGQDASDVEGQAELLVAKNRHGPTGTPKVHFDGPTTRFSDIDRSDA
jgi:replicative DNA helicase